MNGGVVDFLASLGIPSVGPTKSLARLETSKTFTRNLLEKYGIPGNPRFRVFGDERGIEPFMAGLEAVVVKPDGLTGGRAFSCRATTSLTGKKLSNIAGLF